MKLSEYIKNYRTEHDLSLRQFAERCGVSHAYIGFLENECNPSTGKPIAPNLESLKALAKGMNITVDELISAVDEFEITIERDALDRLLAYYEKLNPAGLAKLQVYADDLADNPKYQKE